jgi:hypothetical protein
MKGSVGRGPLPALNATYVWPRSDLPIVEAGPADGQVIQEPVDPPLHLCELGG